MRKPIIVCIVGSSKFRDYIRGLEQRETLKGKVTLQHGFYHHKDMVPISDTQKRELDELMLRKVDLADEVLVCNLNGYIGDSTKKAIEYAKSQHKPIRYEDRKSQPEGAT
jgi:hypothetical protein